MTIDLLWSLPKYLAHLDPVWAALPAELRGRRIDRETRTPSPRPDHRRSGKSDVALVAGYLDMREARRRGYKRIALLEHGIGQSYSGTDAHLPGGNDRQDVGLFLSPNQHAADRDAARYPRARVAVVGSTVLDTLPRRIAGPEPVATHHRPTVALSWHWHYTKVPEMRSAFEHFRQSLAELAGEFAILGHAHPQAVGMVLGTYKRIGIEFEPSYRRVFERADILVADNTSALYEFASTGRPVVVLNAPEYRRDVNHGLRFWDAADVGVQVDEPTGLVAGVAEALKDSPEHRRARKRALEVVYAYPKGAAKRAAKELAAWVG